MKIDHVPTRSPERHVNLRQKTEAEIAKALIKIACGDGPIGSNTIGCLEELHLRLKALNPKWTLRKIKSIYFNEPATVHFYEVVDLIKVSGQGSTDQLDRAIAVVISTFWEGCRP